MAVKEIEQSKLENIGIDYRKEHVGKSFIDSMDPYTKDNQYSAEHPYAVSTPDSASSYDQVHGKGTQTPMTYTPFGLSGKQIRYSNMDTFNGGGTKDIEARKNAQVINIYNTESEYGHVDTTANRLEGQIVVE